MDLDNELKNNRTNKQSVKAKSRRKTQWHDQNQHTIVRYGRLIKKT